MQKNTAKISSGIEEDSAEYIPVSAERRKSTKLPQKPSPGSKMAKVRHDWYQSESEITIEVLLKNQKAEDVSVNFTSDSLSVEVKLPEDVYELKMKLAHEINPEMSQFKVLTSKIEIRLRKISAGQWTLLESKAVEESQQSTEASAPNYPTSSSKKHDWNKLEKEIEKEAEDENEVGDLFKKIYSQGSEEVRRAMNKSFMESSGTVLSTNWGDVGTRKVDVKAPEGTSYKKFT